MNSSLLRERFLDYFKNQGHTVLPSVSLVPAHDPSLLFTNAGMLPFKEIFLGLEQRPYSRAASIQRCVRAGGKHNDLENVGYTARHHTFFEMMGNFSFGDYFKREAIHYSWEFLTERLRLSPKKLWITVFTEDEEAEAIWLNEIRVDPSRLTRCGARDNFWAMGDTGPCGPCSEIFYDHGSGLFGGPPGTPTAAGDRYVEIWNLVFMQFQRLADGSLVPLPKPSVDTGMGLERLAAVMQGVSSNYDTDLFRPLMQAAAQQAGIVDLTSISLRVIADHIRSCAFLISDGVLPGNEGRSYVLRRIIRRAIRHGHKLGLDRPFFYLLVEPLAQQMRQFYPELERAKESIARVLLQEEQQFAKTLTQGLEILDQELIKWQAKGQLPGDSLFRLYDTYGFPIDLTADVAREHGLTIDRAGFEVEMQRQRDQSKAASQFSTLTAFPLPENVSTVFVGYEALIQMDVPVLALLKANQQLSEGLSEGEEGFVILAKTPFYPEGGGQVGDTGYLSTTSSQFLVMQTLKEGDLILHKGKLIKGCLKKRERVKAEVDGDRRLAITLNHSATHLLHAALREILGKQVMQKGSLVEPERLRFDFSYTGSLSVDQLNAVENLVNQHIRANQPVLVQNMTLEQARCNGALAMFGEKYGDTVRVLTMGDFSKELCGGTHVPRTGDIGLFKITGELGISSGVRRIQAVTGQYALDWVLALEKEVNQLASLLKTSRDRLVKKVGHELEDKESLRTQFVILKQSIVRIIGDEIAAQAVEWHGVKLLVSEIHELDDSGLRSLWDQLRDKLGPTVVILASVIHDRVKFIVGVSKELTQCIRADELAKEIAQSIGGNGGGRPDFAQAGASKVKNLGGVLEKIRHLLETRLNANYA